MNVTALALFPLLHLTTQSDKVLLQVDQQVNDRTEYQIKIDMLANDQTGKVVGTVQGAMHIADRLTSRSATDLTYRVHTAASFFKGTGEMEATAKAMSGGAGIDFNKTIRFDGSPVSEAAARGVTSSIDLRLSPNPVAVGDTWTTEISPGLQMQLTVTFKLESINASEYKVSANITKNEQFELIEPYVFMVDRKTGRYKTCTGALQVNAPEGKLTARFNCRRIYPALPQFYGQN